MPESPDSAGNAAGNAADERKRLREGLLDQLAHLVRETRMLEGAVGRVPEKLLSEAPPDEAHSIKEIFALIARLDEDVHLQRIQRIAREDAPRLAPADPEALLGNEDWNAQPMAALFERVRSARRGLIEALRDVPPKDWLRVGRFPEEEAARDPAAEEGDRAATEQDLYWMAHALCQRDRARLEAMTRRLYESHMGPAPEERGSTREREHG